jgi:hypothetical protein
MEYKITKVYLVEAENRHEAKRRIAADGATHLQVMSIQEVKAPGEWPTIGALAEPMLLEGASGPGWAS